MTAVPLVDEKGLIQGSVALFIGLDWLARRYQRAAPSEDGAAFALLDGQGEVITRDASQSPAKSPLPRNSLIHEHLREQLGPGRHRRSARAATTASGACTRSVRCSAAASS